MFTVESKSTCIESDSVMKLNTGCRQLEDNDTVKYKHIFCNCPVAIKIKHITFEKVDPSLQNLKTISFNKMLSYLTGPNLLDEL